MQDGRHVGPWDLEPGWRGWNPGSACAALYPACSSSLQLSPVRPESWQHLRLRAPVKIPTVDMTGSGRLSSWPHRPVEPGPAHTWGPSSPVGQECLSHPLEAWVRGGQMPVCGCCSRKEVELIDWEYT